MKKESVLSIEGGLIWFPEVMIFNKADLAILLILLQLILKLSMYIQ